MESAFQKIYNLLIIPGVSIFSCQLLQKCNVQIGYKYTLNYHRNYDIIVHNHGRSMSIFRRLHENSKSPALGHPVRCFPSVSAMLLFVAGLLASGQIRTWDLDLCSPWFYRLHDFCQHRKGLCPVHAESCGGSLRPERSPYCIQ